MLISVHLPKTAGSSFSQSLQDHFGSTLLKDYTDLPLHKTKLSRNLHASMQNIHNHIKDYQYIRAIHGHFLPYKYIPLSSRQKCTFVTWLRDPAERLASQYFYMKRHYSKEKALKQPLLKRIVEEQWSLEEFCLAPELHNVYTKFFWRFPIDKFDFIGTIDNYQSDLEFFSQNILNSPLEEYKKNTNPAILKPSYFTDNSFKEFIIKHHSKDNCLYLNALKISNRRQI